MKHAHDLHGKDLRLPHAAGVIPGVAILFLLALLTGCTREPSTKLSFNEAIQPILSENCYSCHGQDASSRKAELRLDREEFAFAPHGKFAAAIVPGKPDQSPLIRRIEAKNPKERMPPPEAHKTLQPEQIALLRQWVEQGARYEPHWAFVAPQRPAVPQRSKEREQWARNEIDHFILERLDKERLAPSPEADKRTLIRRVTYDLTGLPPAPEEVAAFLADTSPDAYEKVVDRLLASPRYGEHRAHYWLDYVRYGDTHGIHFDNYRDIWPYRDYVIRAYNANKPFDQFVREQLAGDLLAEQSVDTLIATGYMRSNPTTNEGGVILEEVFVNLTRDRVETFGVTFLGITTGCAACHDHKFDPILHKDFYQLAAFLNNTADAPLDFNMPDPPPVLRLPEEKDRAAHAAMDDLNALVRERGKLRSQWLARRVEAPKLMRARLAAGHAPQSVSADALELRLRFDEGQGQVVKNSAPHAAIAQFKSDSQPIVWGEKSWLWPSARFNIQTRLPLDKVADVEADQPFSAGGWFMPHSGGTLFARLGDPKGPNGRGWAISFVRDPSTDYSRLSGRLLVSLVSDPTTASRQAEPEKRPPSFTPAKRAIQVRTRDEISPKPWMHVFVTYDGLRNAEGVRIYVDGKLASAQVLNDSLGPNDSISTGATTHLGRRDAGEPLEAGYQDIRFYRRALSPSEVARLPFEDVAHEIVARRSDPAKWNSDEAFVVLDRYLLGEQDTEAQQLRTKMENLQARIEAFVPPPKRETKTGKNPLAIAPGQSAAAALQTLINEPPASLIAQEKDTPAYAHILERGNYAARLERVEPGVPHFLPPLAADTTPNRLALANWLFTAQNPLFARVTVNRMWQELFGAGLVQSAGDFGVTGDRPSHPKLLDWLAVEFRESGWDVKRLYRALVLSATYRQSAHVTPESLRLDPANRLLARGPRFRMDAEGIRDSALAVSGLLVERIGGPPVKPYQPPGLWQEVAMPDSNTMEYAQDSGEGLYRRSVYSFLKRSAPPPSLETFDATSREVACLRRARTDTPLQALVTWNDPQFVEAARVLAQRALRARPDTAGRMDLLADITLNRPLSKDEQAILERSLQELTQQFDSQPQNAKQLLSVGDTRPDSAVNPRELAAWTLVASQFLNLDEFLTK